MWLITEEFAAELQRLRSITPTSEQMSQFLALASDHAMAEVPRGMSLAGSVAEIRVVGPLSKQPSFMAWLAGGENTTYTDIQASLAAAQADPAIKSVVLFIDSPGGEVDGLFETFETIKAFSKPISVRAANATSAAYGIAAVAGGKVTATNAAAMFGSVGVAATYLYDESLIDITSTEAPEKRPDVSTEEGKAVIRKRLDDIHGLFAEEIAKGRGVTVATVNASYGRGGVLLARDAKSAGMIDAVQKPAAGSRSRAQANASEAFEASESNQIIQPIADASGERGEVTQTQSAPPRMVASTRKPMNLEELKTQHPQLFAEVVAFARAEGEQAGVDAGTAKERKRVCAHLKLGEGCGDLSIAVAAIRGGTDGLDPEVFADYQAAQWRNTAVRDRNEETRAAGDAVSGASDGAADEEDLGDRVATALEAQMGIKANG